MSTQRRRLVWFACMYLGSVLSFALIALLVRTILKVLYMRNF
jgi:hypothetical protein